MGFFRDTKVLNSSRMCGMSSGRGAKSLVLYWIHGLEEGGSTCGSGSGNWCAAHILVVVLVDALSVSCATLEVSKLRVGTKSGDYFALCCQHFDRPQAGRPKRPERHRLPHQCYRRLSGFGLSFEQGSRYLEER